MIYKMYTDVDTEKSVKLKLIYAFIVSYMYNNLEFSYKNLIILNFNKSEFDYRRLSDLEMYVYVRIKYTLVFNIPPLLELFACKVYKDIICK